LPLINLSDNQARFWMYDSLLSEYAVMAFEYGYSVEREDALVLWEAQFGDFADGAQTVIDEYISSSEQKWGQRSSVVLLLPHGFEGQGPDHSSARIERYLQLCAENNMIVARPSTPAQHFHLLRRQAYSRPRKPLIVFTPKAMLRLRDASSNVEDFTQGRFQEVIDETRGLDRSAVQRVIITAGKPYHDVMAEVAKSGDTRVAVVRLEQFYPAPMAALNSVLETYPNAELVWFQDEPANQGAWPFINNEIAPLLNGRTIRNISRPSAASPAVGSAKRHAVEAAAILEEALRF
jgi:2-oxoglutarate dehydrogenase E1 component